MNIMASYFAPPEPQFSNVIGKRTHLILEDENDLTIDQQKIIQASRAHEDNASRRIANIKRCLDAVIDGCDTVPMVAYETKLCEATARAALNVLVAQGMVRQTSAKSNKKIYTPVDNHD